MRDVLPSEIYDDIRDHLEDRGNAAGPPAWHSAHGDEDSITGDFCSQLRRPPTYRVVGGVQWEWRVDYTKLRGRGPGAPEKLTGCDGIVSIEVAGPEGSPGVSKALLFQAKKGRIGSDSELIEQVTSMEGIAPHGSAVFEYNQDRFTAMSGQSYLESSPKYRRDHEARPSIGSFLAEEFLACSVGLLGVYFDAVRQVLVVPDNGNASQLRFSIVHRVRVEVAGRISEPL